MRNYIKKAYIYMVVPAMSLTFTACQPDFEAINTDHRHPTENDLQKDGLKAGGYLTTFQQSIFPVGSSGTNYVNDYQIPYTLAGASWIGYMAPAQNKWVGKGFPTYGLRAWSNYTYNVMAGTPLRYWMDFKKRTTDDAAAFALAQIIKVAAVHKATDTFGPIPYSQTGKEGVLQSVYDSQQDVYKQMLRELDEAVATLDKEAHNILPQYDIVYEGDYKKWMKFANSLMLRLAMRVVYADETLAKTYAEKAISNPQGVFEVAKDMAQLSKGAGVMLKNPLVIINNDYNDVRMGAEIYSYLKGYKDPRIASYFVQATIGGVTDYYAVRTNLPSKTDYLDKKSFSTLNVEKSTPVYIMKTSEVYFLRAEGALRNWDMGSGTAQAFYEKGITTSFEENGLAASAAMAYVANSTAKPAKYVDPVNSEYSKDAATDITIKWTSTDTFEKNLERIITQKYLAIYPDGQEAWSEFRRTGYPKIFTPVLIATDADVAGYGPTRIPYSNEEYNKNLENITKAVTLLGGSDNGATKVWWDKKKK